MSRVEGLFNWNNGHDDRVTSIIDIQPHPPQGSNLDINIVDESPRDGLQGVSNVSPTVVDKLKLVGLAKAIGIRECTVGIYGGQEANYVTSEVVSRMSDMDVKPIVLGRALNVDTEFMTQLYDSNPKLVPLMFFGSSGLRTKVEGWDMDQMFLDLAKSTDTLAKLGAEVMVATEDTTRTTPDDLIKLARVAIDHGAKRICIADTVGTATCVGAYRIVKFLRNWMDENGGKDISIDWHGHNDIGWAVPNALAAVAAGAESVHGVITGIGERAGNMPLEIFLVNLAHLDIAHNYDLTNIMEYAEAYSQLTGVPIPKYAPVIGGNAFNTIAGIHAAAIKKALERKDLNTAALVYSAYSPQLLGRELTTEIGLYSGLSNVYLYCMLNHLSQPNHEQAEIILAKAQYILKGERRTITKEEVNEMLQLKKV